MDVNNPNRDLSDPNWISSGAYHHEMRKQMKQSIPQQIPQKLKVVYFDGHEDFEYIEIYDPNLKCESCNKTGSYFIENDFEKLGSCMFHLKQQYKSVVELI